MPDRQSVGRDQRDQRSVVYLAEFKAKRNVRRLKISMAYEPSGMTAAARDVLRPGWRPEMDKACMRASRGGRTGVAGRETF